MRLPAVGLFIILAVVGAYAYGCDQRRRGGDDALLEAKRKGLLGRVDTIAKHIRQTDTLYRQETKTLTTVRLKTDTLLRTDTLFDAEAVRQIVGRERTACDAVIATCEVRVAQRDSMLLAKDSLLSTYTRPHSRWFGFLPRPVPFLEAEFGVLGARRDTLDIRGGIAVKIGTVRLQAGASTERRAFVGARIEFGKP